MIGILLAVCWQGEPLSPAHDLVERLRSDEYDVRESATQGLKKLATRALPELHRAASDRDPEVRERALLLVRTIEISERLTPNLKKVLGGVEDRLAIGDARTWTLVFLEATAANGEKRIFPTLTPEDLGALAPPALRGADTCDDLSQVCQRIESLHLTSAVQELIVLLGREDVVARKSALWTLQSLDAREAIPGIARLLEDSAPGIRAAAAWALGSLKAESEKSRIARLLKDPHPNARSAAGFALAALGAKDYIREVTALLDDPCPEVRANSTCPVAELASGTGYPRPVLRLLFDPEGSVRWCALQVLLSAGLETHDPELKRLLLDSDPALRKGAAMVLCQKGSAHGVPVLLEAADGLSWLNGIRKPEAWERMMMSRTTRSAADGTWREALQQIADDLGLKLEVQDGSWLKVPVAAGLTAFDLFTRPEGHPQFILEVDRIRILSAQEAHTFWKAWRPPGVEHP